MGVMFEFIVDHQAELGLRTLQHLALTGTSISLAILIGVPLGVVCDRVPTMRGLVLGVVGILQTVPSLAMLALLLVATGKIGWLPAILSLTLYALLPIVRNTVTGLETIEPELIEAARGLGMSRWQQLYLVQLPLAVPVIIAGVRTAAVIGIGIATLAAFIGAGGLGQFIVTGLAMYNVPLILLGSIPAGILAMIVDRGFELVDRALDPRRTKRSVLAGTAAILLWFAVFALGTVSYFGVRPDVVIGSKNFSEQFILGHMMAELIEEHTDLVVDRRFSLGGTMICHAALVLGEIDMYPEYTGTGLVTILKRPVVSDSQVVYDTVQRVYERDLNCRWLEPFGINNTFAITVRRTDAEQFGWTKISDLTERAKQLRIGFPPEFSERADGYPNFRKVYFDFGTATHLDSGLMYDAIAAREVDVIPAFTTDGRIRAYDLKPLEDDRRYFPPYFVAPVVREESLQRHPELAAVLNRLGGRLDDETMRRLNLEVDRHQRDPKAVAREFLARAGLIRHRN
jgi:osmoprotectant transport system permease protein